MISVSSQAQAFSRHLCNFPTNSEQSQLHPFLRAEANSKQRSQGTQVPLCFLGCPFVPHLSCTYTTTWWPDALLTRGC